MGIVAGEGRQHIDYPQRVAEGRCGRPRQTVDAEDDWRQCHPQDHVTRSWSAPAACSQWVTTGPQRSACSRVVSGLHQTRNSASRPSTILHTSSSNITPTGRAATTATCSTLWQVLAQEVDVRYRVIPLLDGGYGSVDGNGTWTGLVGELAYGRADIALSWLGIIGNRTSVVNFLDAIPVSSFQDRFYVRGGPDQVPRITVGMFGMLLKPLGDDVWWTLLATLLVISVLLRVCLRLSLRWKEDREMADGMTWGSCVLSCFGTVVGQGWAVTPNSPAARVVTLSNWMLGILLCASYTANLMSHLTVPTTSRAIRSLQDFSEQRDWYLALEPGGGILNVWKSSEKEHERELFHRAETKDHYIELYPHPANRSALNTDKVLTYADINRLRYALGRFSCDLTPLLDEPAEPPVQAYIPIAKRWSALRRRLNRVLLAMTEAGLVRHLKRRWLPEQQNVCDPPEANFEPLSGINLLAMLLLVPLAVVFGVIFLFLELLWFRTQ